MESDIKCTNYIICKS